MKKIYWIIILISFQSYSQNEQWKDFELDSKVRFQLPTENANLFDSIQNGVKMYELSKELNETFYSGNKMTIEFNGPKNTEELKALYEDAMSDVSKSYPNTTEKKLDIEKNGLLGRKLSLTDNNGNLLFESELYFLDDNLYMFNCASKNRKAVKDNQYFFDKISLPNKTETKQLTGKSNFLILLSTFKTELLILLGIVVVVIGIIVIKKNYLQHRV